VPNKDELVAARTAARDALAARESPIREQEQVIVDLKIALRKANEAWVGTGSSSNSSSSIYNMLPPQQLQPKSEVLASKVSWPDDDALRAFLAKFDVIINGNDLGQTVPCVSSKGFTVLQLMERVHALNYWLGLDTSIAEQPPCVVDVHKLEAHFAEIRSGTTRERTGLNEAEAQRNRHLQDADLYGFVVLLILFHRSHRDHLLSPKQTAATTLYAPVLMQLRSSTNTAQQTCLSFSTFNPKSNLNKNQTKREGAQRGQGSKAGGKEADVDSNNVGSSAGCDPDVRSFFVGFLI
jgi:hypothetical protein